MYLVQLQQHDRSHTVGLFTEKSEAKAWIESLSYVDKERDTFDDKEYVTYTMSYEDVPLYDEIVWKNSRFPLTRYMFTPDDGKIEFLISYLPIMNEVNGRVQGMTQVDAYMIPNKETESYINTREEIRTAITQHYEKLVKNVTAGGVGSQDGEYLLVEGALLVHLDALTVQQWEEKTTVEDFIKQCEP